MLILSRWETFVSELVSKPGYSGVCDLIKNTLMEKMPSLLLVLKISLWPDFITTSMFCPVSQCLHNTGIFGS